MSERKINILGVGEYKKNLEDVTHYIDDCINRLSSSVKNLSSDIIKGDLADRLDEAYDKLYKVRDEVNKELNSFTDWLGKNIEFSVLLDERHARELENELNGMDFFKDGYTISGGNAFLTGDNNLTFNTPATSQSSEKETKATSSNVTLATPSTATPSTATPSTATPSTATQSNGTTETGRFYIPDLKKYENNSNGSLSNGTSATGKYDNSHLTIS